MRQRLHGRSGLPPRIKPERGQSSLGRLRWLDRANLRRVPRNAEHTSELGKSPDICAHTDTRTRIRLILALHGGIGARGKIIHRRYCTWRFARIGTPSTACNFRPFSIDSKIERSLTKSSVCTVWSVVSMCDLCVQCCRTVWSVRWVSVRSPIKKQTYRNLPVS